MATPELVPRPLAPTLSALLTRCTSGEPMVPDDSKSGARFERVVIDGRSMVLKYQDARDDWLMRASGDLEGRRFVSLWESGLLDALPKEIDHAVAGAAAEGEGGGSPDARRLGPTGAARGRTHPPAAAPALPRPHG
ncbi:MAG: hypothetical protein ACRDYC_07565 [Acidimicrobiales bacterium]